MDIGEPKVLLEGLYFPEGPRWRDGKLWFSDIHAHKVWTVDMQGNGEVLLEWDGRPSGIGFLPDGTPLLVSMLESKIYRLGPGGPTLHADLSGLSSSMNDMVVDAQGRAYAGISLGAPGAAERTGGLALIMPNGSFRKVAEGMQLPNGSVITPDGRTLIVGDTFVNQLVAFDIQTDGSLSNPRVFAEVAPHQPDGIALDAERAVWLASPGTSAFVRVREGGEITDVIELRDKLAIACMLGGPDRKTLFLLTNGMEFRNIMPLFSGEANPAEICRGFIETLMVAVPGAGWP